MQSFYGRPMRVCGGAYFVFHSFSHFSSSVLTILLGKRYRGKLQKMEVILIFLAANEQV